MTTRNAGRRFVRAAAAAAVAAAAGGCALPINGRTQRIAVTSTPPHARVLLDGNPVGVTPLDVDVRRRDADARLRIEKEGFRPEERPLRRSWSRWLLLDAPAGYFLGGLVGLLILQEDGGIPDRRGRGPVLGGLSAGLAPAIVDVVTGAAFAFPFQAHADLVPAGAPRREPVPGTPAALPVRLPGGADLRRALARAGAPTVTDRRDAALAERVRRLHRARGGAKSPRK